MLRQKSSGILVRLFFDFLADCFQVKVSEWQARFGLVLLNWMPNVIATFLRFVASFSGALALLNLAPVYRLDGEWALRAALELVYQDKATRDRVAKFILVPTTALLVLTIIGSFVSLVW